MALGFTNDTQSGDILPIVKWDARAGKLFKRERSLEDGAWVSDDVEVGVPVAFIMDLANIEVGWIAFVKGTPHFHFRPAGHGLPPKPDLVDEEGKNPYRQGFRVRLYSPKALGGIREFSHAARVVTEAVDLLHDEFLKTEADHPGMVPVVQLVGSRPVKARIGSTGQTQTNYAPDLRITKWTARPAELAAPTVRAEAEPAAGGTPGAAPRNGNGNGRSAAAAPPSAREAVPPAAAAGDDDFGAEFDELHAGVSRGDAAASAGDDAPDF